MAALALTAACSSLDKADPTLKWDAERLYRESRDELDSGNYGRARELLEKLESRFPFGRIAQQAQMEIAYTYYKEGDPAQAVSAADRFLKLNPNHPNADYVHYLKGLANYIEPPFLIGRLINYQVGERDAKALRDSFDAFRELVTRYPDSTYAADARQRMGKLIDALAQGEVTIASYYFRRGAYLAAATRAQSALKEYPESPALEDALVLMIRSYDALGMVELKHDAERILAVNFPNSTKLAALR